MPNAQDNFIYGVPRRPRGEYGAGGTILGALAGLALASNPLIAIGGAILGGAIGSRPQPLEDAVRAEFQRRGHPVSLFYRSPRGIKIVFFYRNGSWRVESYAPMNLPFNNNDDLEDWLYGNLIAVSLPNKLQVINQLQGR
jgi:hypothetical protein